MFYRRVIPMIIKYDDVIGIVLIAIGIIMTALLYVAVRHPTDIESITIQEVPSHQAPHNNGI